MSEMIPKGCTCVNRFTFPYPEKDVEALFITYQQDRKTVFEKQLSDCVFDEDSISVKLTQEDTLKLKDDGTIQIQIRVRLYSGSVVKSEIIKTYTDAVLKEEVI
jgi:hypothetical protein